jgi:hypothetical protein
VPWEFEFPFPGSLVSTLLGYLACSVSASSARGVTREGLPRNSAPARLRFEG